MITKLSFHLLVVLSILLAALPAQAAQAKIVAPAPAAAPGAAGNLLQFSSGGHILGFNAGGMYAATGSHVLHVDFVGANPVAPQADSTASPALPRPVLGKPDMTQAATSLKTGNTGKAAALSQVTYADLWDGISLAYTAGAGSLYITTYTLKPDADPARIRLHYNAPLSLHTDGTLGIAFQTGSMSESAPLAWQEINGQRVQVQVVFQAKGSEVGFRLGAYNPHYALTIDPSVIWNSFLGGSSNDFGRSIAVDGSGNVYVTGYSSVYWGSPVRNYSSGSDAFVAKLSASGGLTWNTFLGGSDNDYGNSIAVDGSGNVYVTGYSLASWGSPVRAYSGNSDTFAAKLTSSGGLTWNTFLGGSNNDFGYGITVDASGNVYVAGYSNGAWSCAPTACTVRTFGGSEDAFAAKLTSSGGLTWNSFLGGSGYVTGAGIALDASLNVYVTGGSSAAWGCSPACTLRAYSGGQDAYAAKLTAAGALAWNTFLGGSGNDNGTGIAVDAGANVYVTGSSDANWGTPVRTFNTGTADAFAARLNASGGLLWNTFLGGSNNDNGGGIAVDSSGNVTVTGDSYATWGSPVRAYSGSYDAFAARLTNSGALTWNTFLGGSGSDVGYGGVVDGSGNIYLVGSSSAAWGNPVVIGDGSDVLVAKLTATGGLTWNSSPGGKIDEFGTGIALAGSGNVYVTGYSSAGWGNPLRAYSGYRDAFIAKLNSSGYLLWNTFLGGSADDYGCGIAVDGSGNIYVTGYSSATWGTPVRAFGGGYYDAFAAKLSSSGGLTWNSFLGGSGDDLGYGIAVDGSGNVYVTGLSLASWGSPVRAYSGSSDAFAAKLTSSGALTWNTFLGGSGDDGGSGIAVDTSGNVYVTGDSYATWSCAPTACTVRAYTGDDAFAAKLNSSGGLTWNTFLGGSATDKGTAIAVDSSGNIYVTGYSGGTWGSPVRAYSGNTDAFVVKLDGPGDLIWSTFLGGSNGDCGYGIALDSSGNIYVTGYSYASWGNPVRAYSGVEDAFAAKLSPTGALVLHTFLGGNGYVQGLAIALDSSGNAFVAGSSTASWGSPVSSYTGGWDAFAAKVDLTAPGVVSILRGSTSPTNAASVSYGVTFSEAVMGVDAGDFTVNTTGITGASVSNVSGSGTTYTVTVNTGVGSGILRLDLVDNDSILDAVANPLGGPGAGNGSYTTGLPYNIDKTPPTVVSIVRVNPNPTNAASVNFSVMFSEDVTGCPACDFSLAASGISGASISNISGSGTSRTVTVATGTGDGSLRLDVVDHDWITDLVGNPLGGSGNGNGSYTSGQSYTVDRTAPTVAASNRANPNPTQSSSVNFTVSFSEAVTGVDSGDFSLWTNGLTGASIGSVSGSGTTYTVSVNTGTGDGTLRLDVADNDTILDLAGNPLGGSGAGNGNFTGGQTYSIDKTAPSVVSSLRLNPSPTSDSNVGFSVTFSEAVTGVDASDFSLQTSGITGASVSDVSGSGTTYTVSVNTGTGDGTLRLDVADNDSILDLASNPLGGSGAGNGNYGGGQSYSIVKTVPRVVSIVRASDNPNNTATVDFTVTFSTTVTGVDKTDFALTKTGLVGASIFPISGSGSSYTVTVATGSGSGTLRLDLIDNDSIQDLASNPLGGTGTGNGDFVSGQTFSIDKSAPHVVASLTASANPTGASSVNFTVSFSEAVTGVDASDFSLHMSGITGSSISNVSGSGSSYTVTAATGTGDGTLRLDVVDDDSILDLAGNPLGGADPGNGDYSGGQTYTVDRTPPEVVSSLRASGATNPTSALSVDFTVSFSEAVTGVDASDFNVSMTGLSGASVSDISGTGSTRTVTVNTGIGSGTLRLDVVDDDSILDLAGNPLGGNGTGNGNHTGDETFSVQKTEVRWFIGLDLGTDPAAVTVEQSVADDFNALHPDIHLTLEVVDSASAPATLTSEIAAGTGPDIVGPIGWQSSNYMHGQTLDLAPLISSSGFDTSIFNPRQVSMYQMEGIQVSLPFSVYPSALFYNPAMFDAAGLHYPPSQYGATYTLPDDTMVLWDWNTLTQVSKLLTLDNTGKNSTQAGFDPNNIVQYGFSFGWESHPNYWGSYWHAGSPLQGVPGSYTAVVPPAWKAAWQWMVDGIWGAQPYIPSTPVFNNFGGGNMFGNGKLAMLDNPSWYLSAGTVDLVNAGGTFQMGAMPAYNGAVAGRMDADTFRIWKDSPHPQAAFTVLTYLVTTGVDKLINGTPPAYPLMLPAQSAKRASWLAAQKTALPFVSDDSWNILMAGMSYPDFPNAEGYVPNFSAAWDRTGALGNEMTSNAGNLDQQVACLQTELTAIFNGNPVPGCVFISGNVGVGGTTLDYTYNGAQTAVADDSGDYWFVVSNAWTGTVTPGKTGYSFSPPSLTYTGITSDQHSQNYTATRILIITGNAGVDGATVNYSGGSPVTAGSDGVYTIHVPYGWTGTVTPSKTGYSFSPPSRHYAGITADQTSESYTATLNTYTITGNAGDAGVKLSYTDGTPKSVTSSSNGHYTITVPYYWSGPVTPSKTGITFTPASRTYTHVTANQTAQNYSDTITFTTTGTYDGWILESAKGSGVGGSMNSSATIFQLGDDISNRQYRAILSFNTASLPDTASISSAVLKVKQSGSVTGSNPFSVLGSLYADIKKGFFGTTSALQVTDFNAAATATKVCTFGKTPVSSWYSATLSSTGRLDVNKTSLTQLRLYFSTASNANNKADYMKFFSGNSSSNQAQLIITYSLP